MRDKKEQNFLDISDPIKKKKQEMENQKVWVPDPKDGFVLGTIQDISQDEVTVLTIKDRKKINVSYDSLYLSGEQIDRDYDDNCSLMYLNEGSLLNNLRIRYEKDQIYTYVANILIAINPYFDISNLYSKSIIEKYQGKSLGVLPPHLFAIADKSFRDLKVLKQNQSIIVSGESGAGKTESTKYVLRYLCSGQYSKESTSDHQIEKLILDANPILEAFGNAKTVRNNNSSRFGKFIEMHYSSKIKISGAHISHYLLEKSRIITQNKDERNYHIFYQLISGLNKNDLQKLNLTNLDNYNYLKNGCTRYFGDSSQYSDKTRCSKEQLQKGPIKDPIVNDLNDFKGLEKAFINFGVSEELKWNIWRIVASVLHLGNVEFEETEDTRGGCRISPRSEESLNLAASLIKIEPLSLKQCLTSRVMQTSKGGIKGTVYMIQLKTSEARNARDALAKALYSRLFDFIVIDIINKSLPYFDSSYYIALLDIAGFEYFQVNCFEQLLINYCNERLQQFFNERILKEEQKIYSMECLQLKQIEFIDNSDCLQLIEKPNGILHLLDEESKLPKSSPYHYTEQVHLLNKSHFNLQIPRKSELKTYRNLRDDEGFIIRHFAGAVCYTTKNFIEKNNDALHNSLQCLMLESSDELVKQLFVSNSNGKVQNGGNKLNLCSVSGKFKSQLSELMEKLNSTGTSFIRCIKPNQAMVKGNFEGSSVLSQLRCSGMKCVMELMSEGYPSRTSFAELYKMYQDFLPLNLRKLDSRMFAKILFKAIGLNEGDYKFGLTRVFFKAGKFAEFDQLIKNEPEHLNKLISKVQKYLIITRWKIASWGALSVIKLKNKIKYRAEKIVKIQAHLRMCSMMVKNRPLIKGLLGLRKLFNINQDLLSKTNQLKDANEKNQIESQLNKLKQDLVQFQSILKNNQIPNENNKPIQQRYNLRREFVDIKLREFRNQLDDKINLFKHKMNEQNELIKMQKKLEEEQQKLKEEEMKRKQDEEKRRIKEEMEARRIKENEEMKRRDELMRQEMIRKEQLASASSNSFSNNTVKNNQNNLLNNEASSMTKSSYFELTDDIIKEDILERRRLEQEKLDHDLAMKLASEMDRKHLEQQFMLNMRSQSNNQSSAINNVPPPLQVSSDHLINGLRNVQQNLKPGQELDLSKWKYSELRDVINTSCDLFLLECCKKEFHRRLKVYHSWKMRNKQQQQNTDEQRAPDSVMKNANVQNYFPTSINLSKEQRYFRVPFVKTTTLSNEKGYWYAHFSGQWIVRQMEIHPNKQPLLLRAGVNDMQMCELSLDETRLTTKRGAEILAEEFESEWMKNGGESWTNQK